MIVNLPVLHVYHDGSSAVLGGSLEALKVTIQNCLFSPRHRVICMCVLFCFVLVWCGVMLCVVCCGVPCFRLELVEFSLWLGIECILLLHARYYVTRYVSKIPSFLPFSVDYITLYTVQRWQFERILLFRPVRGWHRWCDERVVDPAED
jgi:hypothetical protein